MTDLPQTRQSLLIRLRDRSDDAWAEFLSIYEKSLFDFAKHKGLQDADAQDVIQEVLAALESKLPTWNLNPEYGKFRGWLFRVARNIAVDKIVERAKAPGAIGDQSIESSSTDESSLFRMQYRRQLLHWAANRVKPRVNENTWLAFWMTAMEGKKVTDVAEELGLTHGNVYAAKFRVTARIQELVESLDDSEPVNWSLSDPLP